MYAGYDLCSSVKLTGPSDEYGTQPTIVELPTLNTSHTDFVTVKCQITLPANLSAQDRAYYRPRLRFYLTADGKVCTLRDENNSHPCNSDDHTCAGFNYTYMPDKEEDIETINFAYNVTTIARMNNSVVTCGVLYHRVDCYSQTAAMISIQDGPTCDQSTTTTNAITTTTESATTTESPTTTLPSTTEDETTITSTTPQPADTGEIIVHRTVFVPVVGIAVLVGITLLVANGIQLAVIIKRRASTEVQVSATNGTALEHGTEFDRDLESEENTTTIRNNNTA